MKPGYATDVEAKASLPKPLQNVGGECAKGLGLLKGLSLFFSLSVSLSVSFSLSLSVSLLSLSQPNFASRPRALRSTSSPAQSCHSALCTAWSSAGPDLGNMSRFRKRLRSGEEIPEWFAFPKVVKVGGAHLGFRFSSCFS